MRSPPAGPDRASRRSPRPQPKRASSWARGPGCPPGRGPELPVARFRPLLLPLPAPPASTCASLPPASAAFPATAGCSCEAAFTITASTPRFPRNQQFTESVSRPQDGNLFYELQITPPPTFTKDNSQNPAWFSSGKSNLIYTVVSKRGPGEDACSGDWEKVKSSPSFPGVALKSKKGFKGE